MRWFAPIVIVALVATGAMPHAHAARTSEHRSSITPSRSPATLVSRHAVVGRGAASDRRSDHGEVFIVSRTALPPAIRTLSLLVPPAIAACRTTPASVDEVARGPPSLVVLSPSSR
jgi:hypothetical protein